MSLEYLLSSRRVSSGNLYAVDSKFSESSFLFLEPTRVHGILLFTIAQASETVAKDTFNSLVIFLLFKQVKYLRFGSRLIVT